MTGKNKSSSIHLRLLAASLLILPLFLGLAAWVLDQAFVDYQLASQKERMRLQQLLLAKAADWDGANWHFGALDEPRLELLNSGLYAFVIAPQGRVLWQSPSAEHIADLADPSAAVLDIAAQLGLYDLAVGEYRFAECLQEHRYFCQGTRIAWGSAGPESIFLIVQTQAEVLSARAVYRDYLLWLLLGTALLLLLAQSLIVRWGLAPLRGIVASIKRLERGEADQLAGPYPQELVPLTDNINILLDSEKSRRARVRNTMDRLAHVLKTPLMLMRNSSEREPQFRELVQAQVNRMLGIIEGELARARLDGRAVAILGKPILVKPVLMRIAEAYGRLPRPEAEAQGHAKPEIDSAGVAADVVFKGEERDLQDLFGSLLENSLKHCRRRISLSACCQHEAGQDWLMLTIGDDGDGIPAGSEQQILQRGSRADSANLGHGLGLSIVVEIVSAYEGSLRVGRSELGGALFSVKLPGGIADSA